MTQILPVPIAYYNVVAYGATGNGVTDDTTAIQAAITAAQSAGGGTVFFPKGSYLISGTLAISADNIQLLGAGWSSYIVAANSFAAGIMIQAQYSSPTGFRYGIKIADLYIDGGKQNIVGIQLDTTYHAVIEHVRVEQVSGTGIYVNSPPGNSFGAYTHIHHCRIYANATVGTGIKTNNSEFSTITDNLIAWYNQSGAYGIYLQNGNNYVSGNTFDECDTSLYMNFTHNNTIIGNQFDRGLTTFININGCNFTRVLGNYFGTYAGGGSGNILTVNTSTGNQGLIANNQASSFGTQWAKWLSESGGTSQPAAVYVNNETLGLTITRNNGVFRNNRGYNPIGLVTAPTFPATTVAATNTTGFDVTAYITNGTGAITQVQIAGFNGTYNNTNLQIAASGWGVVRLPAGAGVKFTYASGSPAWVWIGD